MEINTTIALGPVGLAIYRDMMTRIEELKEIGTYENKVLKFFREKKVDMAVVVELTYSNVTTSVAAGTNLTELVVSLGHTVGRHYGSNIENKLKGEIGNFIIDIYMRLGMVNRKLKFIKKKEIYRVYAVNRGMLSALMKEFPKNSNSEVPLFEVASDWTNGSSYDAQGNRVDAVRGIDTLTLNKINSVETPLLMKVLNKKQSIKYRVCSRTRDIFNKCLKLKHPGGALDFFDPDLKMGQKKRKSKLLQAELLASIADGRDEFFQRYFMDFRGRLYPASAFLNEIGNKIAKGLIQFSDGVALGERGLFRLAQHIANSAGQDKLPVEDRAKWVEDNQDELCSYADDPLTNTGWMKGDSPWQLLSACFELNDVVAHVDAGNTPETFISRTIVYYDGSNNGCQWGMALAKDDVNGHLVNIKKTDDGLPGDFYTFIADKVFDRINQVEVTPKMKNTFNTVIAQLHSLRNEHRAVELELSKSKSKEALKLKLKEITDKLSHIQSNNADDMREASPLYWRNYIAGKTGSYIRKIVKRPVMTYMYSGTPTGFRTQILDEIDNSSKSDYLSNISFCDAMYLANLITKVIKEEFSGLSKMRDYLGNTAAADIKATGSNFRMQLPLSNFPFVNHYMVNKGKPNWFNFYTRDENDNLVYGKHRLNLGNETEDIAKDKAKNGIAPNFIHSLDALHLMLTIEECQFDIVSCHDSYGAHAAYGDELNQSIRSNFIKVLEADPLGEFDKAAGSLVQMPKKGNLDYNEILEAEYCFS